MANVNNKFGFRLSRKRGKCVESNPYTAAAGADIPEGSPVKLQANGSVAVYAAGDGKILGVAAATWKDGSIHPVFVYDDPESVFEGQATTFSSVDVGQNVDVAATPTTDPSTGRSGDGFDGATYASTAALPFKVLGLSDRDGNEFGAFAKIDCKLNNSVKGSGDGSTGV